LYNLNCAIILFILLYLNEGVNIWCHWWNSFTYVWCDMMGDGLEKALGETMKKILTVLTGKVWSAFLVGIFLTAIVQSSTAITVLTVGFVNSGLMNLPQAVGIIYGANIGTTITAQLMAFSFKFKLTDVALPILGVGFGMMFLGLKILNSGIPFMQESKYLKC